VPFDVSDVFLVAECLSCDHDEIPLDYWGKTHQGRWRSAVSRAYYSVFLELKKIVRTERPGFRIPKEGVHETMRDALDATRGVTEGFRGAFLTLRRKREDADYNLDQMYAVEAATDAIDSAEILLDQIDLWSLELRSEFGLTYQTTAANRPPRLRR